MKAFTLVFAICMSSPVVAEQTRDAYGRMMHIYEGTEAESLLIRKINSKIWVQRRYERLDSLRAKLFNF